MSSSLERDVASNLVFAETLDEDYEAFDHDGVVIYNDASDSETVFPEPLDEEFEPTFELPEALIAAGIASNDYLELERFRTKDPDPLTSVQRFLALVQLVYGPRWQRPLSRDQKHTQGHFGYIKRGLRDLTIDVQWEVLSACVKKIRQDEKRLARAKAAMIKMIDALDR